MDHAAQSLEAIFDTALRQADPAERAAYLSSACRGNPGLRARVEALLKAHGDAGSFLQAPAVNEDSSFAATIDGAPSADFDSLAFRRSSSESGQDGLAEQPGTHIGHYKLLQRIGEGGFGTVWMADQQRPVRRRVALKIIKPGMDTKQVIARFEQERQALALMDHPNIARVLDAGATQTGRPYFVMELVRGVKITDYCDDHGLSTAERIHLFITVCHAVQHAHQKGIIHRDLKPSNILVTVNDGEAVPKVIDFGVAKATQGRLADGTLFTQFEQMIGTPLYMSPEQAEMTSLDVDTRSDIYSLGVLLYELLTSRTPIDTDTMARAGMDEVRRLIREVDPPRPSARLKTLAGAELTTVAKRRHTEATKLSGALRGDIDWIVMKCLEKDRKRRYDTANGLAMDLQRHLHNEVVIARPPTTAYLLSKLVRRNKVACIAGGAILVSLLIGIAASLWQAVRADREATRARSAEQRAVTTVDELRATAPAFVEQARALAAKEQFDQAIQKLDYALKLRPDTPEYLLAKADLLQCQLKLAEAAAIYQQALRARPGLGRAESSAKLCNELLAAPLSDQGKLSRESLAKLHVAMQRQQRPAAELMPVARLLGEEKKLLVDYWLARFKDLPVSSERPLKDRLTVRDDSRLALDLSDTQVTDLSPLVGAPLAVLNVSGSRELLELTDLSPLRGLDLIELNIGMTRVADLSPLREIPTLQKLEISGSQVTDLAPLSGLRLRSLSLRGCAIRDLSPLKSMPLEELNLRQTRVANLSPLEGMPLRSIDLSSTPVRDFSPLARLPLEKCYLEQTSIVDLSVLRGMPLKELVLQGSSSARNYATLSGIKSLELLLLDGWYRNLPDWDYLAIGMLRLHPSLRQIGAGVYNARVSFGIDPKDNSEARYAATGSKDVFWQDWDRDQSFVPALRRSGIKFNLHKHASGVDHLTITQQPLRDLSILKDARVGILTLWDCPFTDLTPIQGLPLETLDLKTDLVADLSPLRQMPLTTLSLRGSKFTDLSPLAGMPLKALYVDPCQNLTDVAVVAQIATLENLTVPIHAKGVAEFRKLAKLQRLAYTSSGTVIDLHLPTTTVEEFWKDFEANRWIARLNDAGVKPTTIKREEDNTWALDLTGSSISDLTLLAGAPISRLNLNNTAVADLAPLRGMPLKSLSIDSTKVVDLSPLAGMPLEHFNAYMTQVSDLAPLRGIPLTNLQLGRSEVADLSPLRGMPLRLLQLFGTKVTDLSPLQGMPLEDLWIGTATDLSALRGMPLKNLRIHECPANIDLSPLTGARELTALTLPAGATNFEFLREFPMLARIGFKQDWKNGGRPDRTAAEFWKEHDESSWLRSLTAAGTTHTAKREPDGKWGITITAKEFRDCSVFKGKPLSSLTLDKTAVVDLEPLRGVPLKHLSVRETNVADLAPLKEMPLEVLDLTQTKAVDVSPLRGMPLKKLYLGRTGIGSLEPLRGMPLRAVVFFGTNVTDIGPLQGMPLEELWVSEVADLAVLRGMPLTSLKLHDCPKNVDLSPLAGARELASLTLPAGATKIDFLRDLPKLARIGFREDWKNGGRPDRTAAEFWKEYDGLAPLRKLSDMGIVIKSGTLLPDGTLDLNVDNSTIEDLAVLRGVPISSLSLNTTVVKDLTPLRDMPIKHLNISNTPVSDLGPLKGMPLNTLVLRNTKVTDLSALRGMPLTSLYLAHSLDLSDLSPLMDCKELTEITLPEKANSFEFLRTFPKLERLSFAETGAGGLRHNIGPDKTAAEFWKEYDAQGWLRNLRESGVAIKHAKPVPDGTWNLDLSEAKLTDLALLKDAPISILSLSKTAITDLTPLKGMSLRILKLDGAPVTDLGPLKGMPLEELNISGTKVADLSPLRGSPLRVLHAGNTAVTDLAPLRGMKLVYLAIYNLKVADLTPLQGMELGRVNFAGIQATDLSPLRGMPLTSVRLHNCGELTDVSPLAEARDLRELTLPPKAKDFEFLRKLPKLENLSFTETTSGVRLPDKTVEQFWTEYDAKKKGK